MQGIGTNNSHNHPQNERIQRFLQLMSLNQSRIYGFVLSLTPQKTDADDIMQETSVTMWEKFDDFEQDTDFSAWGIKIARYKIMNYRQKHSGKNKQFYLSDQAIEVLESKSDKVFKHIDPRIEALRSCVKKLNSSDQTVLHLRYDNELPVEVMAERLGRSSKTIYRILSRIQDALIRCVRLTLATE
ncbi:RNA polymerase sigma factor [Anaerohalosphaera lusitana]|uniref:RNA polymerase sigma factor n=1 Tax=Anaerohalosphaera lusitana TaxID=1936003 RepID=A0A1U9NPK1_9BACT|nr:sigma-70 family RNA polymerase sigma factor [Anaerohalosphaera lusitana]AQT69765.1 RNA polymerase sigma factor [Anaerohalosphaera lusitana]